jgi:uncharacterized membrane protein
MAALALLSLGVAGYAAGVYGFLPVGVLVHPDMRATFEAQRALVYLHVFASLWALVIGPIQFSARLRTARPRLHRWLGRLYLGVGVLVGGVAGLLMAITAYGGWVAKLGFGLLALAWLGSGWFAWHAIRRGDRVAHRQWMVRNFALTFAAVTLRIWLPLALGAGVPFEVAYPAVAWLSWVPNLLIAHWILKRATEARGIPSRPQALPTT